MCGTDFSYAAMRCAAPTPVLHVLHMADAVSSTNIAYGLRPPYAVSGTEIAYRASLFRTDPLRPPSPPSPRADQVAYRPTRFLCDVRYRPSV
eukprot:3333792-Rhodomonas_salina.1